MKKLISCLLALVTILSLLTACGGSGNDNSSNPGSSGGDAAKTVPSINDIKLGEDFQDITAEVKVLTNRTDIVDTVYGIANGGTADGVAYNKKVFEAAGYTKDNMPATPSQFMQALRDIKAKTDAIPLYTNFADKWPMGAWDAYIAVAATGDQDFRNYKIVHTANPFADRGDETGPYAVYSILYNAVAEGLVEADPMSSDWEGSKGMINRGEIGAMVLGSWAVQQFKEAGDNPDDVAYMPFPITVTDDAGSRVTSAGGNYSYAINCKTSADQQIASLLYVKWLLEESSIFTDEGCIPALKSAFAGPQSGKQRIQFPYSPRPYAGPPVLNKSPNS